MYVCGYFFLGGGGIWVLGVCFLWGRGDLGFVCVCMCVFMLVRNQCYLFEPLSVKVFEFTALPTKVISTRLGVNNLFMSKCWL